MHSIKSKITLITVSAIVITMLLAMILGINAVVRIGQERSGQILELLCETGEKNLDFYFEDFERSVGMVSSYAEADLETRDVSDMERHVEHVRPFFERIAEQNKNQASEIANLKEMIDRTPMKTGIVKYDAFPDVGGRMSFALAMLDMNNTGFVINAIHSKEGCYTYIKEIVKGESYIVLGEEEKEALRQAVVTFENNSSAAGSSK